VANSVTVVAIEPAIAGLRREQRPGERNALPLAPGELAALVELASEGALPSGGQ
jgi:hypothetical protein